MQDCTNRPERLDKLLASSGLVSRSEAKTAVARGRVTVDGISAHPHRRNNALLIGAY